MSDDKVKYGKGRVHNVEGRGWAVLDVDIPAVDPPL